MPYIHKGLDTVSRLNCCASAPLQPSLPGCLCAPCLSHLLSIAHTLHLCTIVWCIDSVTHLLATGLGTPGGVAKIDFGGVTDAIFVNATGNLTFQSVTLQGATSQNGFSTLLPRQQFLHIQGSGIWPTVIQDLGSTVSSAILSSKHDVQQCAGNASIHHLCSMDLCNDMTAVQLQHHA